MSDGKFALWWMDSPRRDRWWWEGGPGPSPSVGLFGRLAGTILGGLFALLAVCTIVRYVHEFVTSWIWAYL